MRFCTTTLSCEETCDYCSAGQETTLYASGQVITLVTLHRREALPFQARFCQRHFLQFSDLIAQQVTSVLYPQAAKLG
jgi:hypothetical protein